MSFYFYLYACENNVKQIAWNLVSLVYLACYRTSIVKAKVKGVRKLESSEVTLTLLPAA